MLCAGQRQPPTQPLFRRRRWGESEAKQFEQQAKLTKLLASILIDLIGVLTYAVPAIGEVGDLAWAPISALLIYNLYGNGLVAGSTCRKRAPVSALQLGASAS